MQIEFNLAEKAVPHPAIAQWLKVAEEAERAGVSGDAYRRAARSIEIEQETGVAVCACCFKPFGRGTLKH
ncbi:hypothetical protein SAMN04490189_4630 [Pseudomonas koreensis]|uniref:hypothetical protein n=1 Tax=Pseudomonas koreensis TaxID=198620 RepID=UPI00087B5C78|nr:hypothetical protein [Pseudomonas koreensis]KAB0510883.1 hypothetical protein F7R05_22025 [Pseudomonas koreensis]NNA64370.1 hypothetical protein [Pseudomonas koreensis]GGK52996.1 hypothetical protein GCM10009103_54200 [Pseudomonas koreensis]SDE19585.1 hypothetical protein SAMN04490189_4630 [Pseudomonas koreensis]